MKKQGFTLAEALITVGIIGVVAALILPAVNNLKPDQNKVLYLKAHDALGYALHGLASNSKLFPAYIQANDISAAEYPLLNTEAPVEERYEDYTGRAKLCNLLALSMNVNSSNVTCSDASYTFAAATFDNDFDNNISFTTQNGMQWRVVPQTYNIGENTAAYQSDIYVDVNGNKEPNCIYNADNCTDPDRFMFLVDAKGNLYIGDPMGREYLAHRKMLTKKSVDLGNAPFLASLDDIKLGLKDFEVVTPDEPNEPVIPDTPDTPDPDPDTPDLPDTPQIVGPVKPINPCATVPEGKRYPPYTTINTCYNRVEWCKNNGFWDNSCNSLSGGIVK